MRRDLVAVNTAPDSENRMHGEEAKAYGFAAGLVPGVDVLGYLAHEAVDRWGADWLAGGRLRGRLLAPVYDGERVRVEVDEGTTPDEVVAQVRGPADDVRAEAVLARLDDAGRQAAIERALAVDLPFVEAPDPERRPDARATELEPGRELASQRATFRRDRAAGYLAEISETADVFHGGGAAHPGWLLRFSNWALSRTVRLGPWIHVSSDAWFLDAVHDGEVLDVRSVVTERFERKGHEMVDLTVRYLVEDRPVALVDHRAIWQPRTRS